MTPLRLAPIRNAALAALASIAAIQLEAQPRITGRWQAEVQPGIFWTVELRLENTRLTGAVEDASDSVEFYDGTVSGNTVVFKATNLFGDTSVVFTGVIAGDQIAFTREVQ